MTRAESEIVGQPKIVQQDQSRDAGGGVGPDPSAPNEIGGNAEAGGAATSGLRPNQRVLPACNTISGDGEGGGDQRRRVRSGQGKDVAPATIAELLEQWRRRQAWHRAEKSLTLQAKALCRRLVAGDKAEAEKVFAAAYGKGEHEMAEVAFAATVPLIDARKSIEAHRKVVEKRLVKLAKSLPVAPYVESVRGVGLLSLAAIVGEAGDLSNYSNPAKLWKRLGLAVMPDGSRQRRVSGEAAVEHGYSPARRSVVWNIGACIVKAGGPLKAVYDARKLYEADRVATKGHAHNRAQRYVEKRFIRDLWAAWRRADGNHTRHDHHASTVLAANLSASAEAEGTTIVEMPPIRGVSPSAN